MRLQPHGYYAWRRLHVQGQIGPVFFGLVSIVPTLLLDLPWWLPLAIWAVFAALAVPVAQEAYRNLGHGLTEEHVISGHGALMRQREVLERGGIIGWVVRQTIFQRRLGLATLVATTAAGPESVTIDDVPYDVALAVAREATPHLFADLP
jgi:putative membrane protein